MATITSAGVGSGLDVETLISRLMSLERQPIKQLQDRTDGLKTQLSAVGKIQSSLSTLRDVAGRLSRPDAFSAATASSSDASAVSATASGTAAPGSYSVSVSRLASAQSVASEALPAGSTMGGGTLTISLGRYSGDLSTFDADPSRTSLVIPVASGDSLEAIRNKINAMKAGVVANVVTDVNGSRLVMRAAETGAANAFRVSVADDDGNDADAAGLSRLAYDPTAGINTGALRQSAQNALASIDGVAIESASNRISGAIEGVSVNLLKTTASGSSTQITVGTDSAALRTQVDDFVKAYNDSVKLLREQTRNDPEAGTGPLRGDQSLVNVQNQLRSLVGSSTTLGGAFARLADIGLNPGKDGLLTVNETKLKAALERPADLRALFGAEDGASPSNSGFALRLRQLGDQLLSTDGRIESSKKGLNNRIDANGDREDRLERRLELVEKRLRAQYTALDGNVSKLNGLSSYLQQQLNRL